MRTKLITVVETFAFLCQAQSIWTDDERSALVDYMARNPESGNVIPGTGGIRKVRWGRAGSGKRGGARVVYFYYHSDAPLYLLLAYAKAGSEDMTAQQKKAVVTVVGALKQQHPPRKE